ncbi:GTP-binding protein, partial [Streptomyces tricolor]
MSIDASLVRRLLAAQFPRWAGLPVRPVPRSGMDNATFRLGDELAVRLPRYAHWAGQVAREQRWLPRLAPRLPLPVPEPVAQGEPGEEYPYPWTVYRWLPGETVTPQSLQRGITIKSAVVSFPLDGVTVNLIDTPGHPDFIAEVERVLGVLDGAVLVVSAVEGVQAQTRVLMRTLRRLRLPTLVFVNKIDRRGARDTAVLRQMAQRLAVPLVPMGTAAGLGTRAARFRPGLGPEALEALADRDDGLLAAYLDGTVPEGRGGGGGG